MKEVLMKKNGKWIRWNGSEQDVLILKDKDGNREEIDESEFCRRYPEAYKFIVQHRVLNNTFN